jgi:NDP-sugar pyrophosphorylase family protein
MKAMVLAAGYGSRLGPLTDHRPKGLLQVGGYSLLELIVARLADHGFKEIAINLHFKPEMIRDRLGDGSALGVSLEYAAEPELLGTAGSVRAMRDFLDNGRPFLIHYGDVVTDQDLDALYQAHVEKKALVTLLVHKRPNSNSVVVLDEKNRITVFLERPDSKVRQRVDSSWVNSGICICESEIFDYFSPEDPLDLPAHVFPKLVQTRSFFGFPIDAYRCAVDSADRLDALRVALAEGRYLLPNSLRRK